MLKKGVFPRGSLRDSMTWIRCIGVHSETETLPLLHQSFISRKLSELTCFRNRPTSPFAPTGEVESINIPCFDGVPAAYAGDARSV